MCVGVLQRATITLHPGVVGAARNRTCSTGSECDNQLTSVLKSYSLILSVVFLLVKRGLEPFVTKISNQLHGKTGY